MASSIESLVSFIKAKLKLFDIESAWTETSNEEVIEFLSESGPKTLSVLKLPPDENHSNERIERRQSVCMTCLHRNL